LRKLGVKAWERTGWILPPLCFINRQKKKETDMKTPIENRDLTKQAPHSPRDRYGDFAILGRTVDKCRASIAETLGEYHYDCSLWLAALCARVKLAMLTFIPG
jgi:hypothetical protein